MKKILFALPILIIACSKVEPEIAAKKEIIEVIDEDQKDISEIDEMVNAFINKHNLPGASVAISKNENLVYTKGYGFANVESKEVATPEHLFRVGSCSKPYTGMAIMKLVEEGKIDLNDKVFGEGAVLGTQFGTRAYGEDLKKITVANLLHNVSGAFVDASGRDLINANEHLSDEQYMNWLLDNTYQEFSPGSQFHYVNVNFFVAAIIVEKVSGLAFEDYLREAVWKPIGDTNSKLGTIAPANMEVTYYGQGVLKGQEYGTYIDRYLGAGNVISTAENLLRFATAIDGKSGKEDLLPQDLLAQYTTGSSVASGQALGIGLWGNRLYFYGSIPGTRSGWILDKSTGLAAAIIFNGNLDYTKASYETFPYEVQDMLVDFISQQRSFQNIDQF